jgi:hypothetical protein
MSGTAAYPALAVTLKALLRRRAIAIENIA